MTNKNVLILGCGPSALFAAHAAELAGFHPTLVSKKRKSEMFGAQYLHRPIPEVSQQGFTVDYVLEGSVEGYKRKVYGPGYRGTVSVEELVGQHEAWDIRSAYDTLWMRYQDRIHHTPFQGGLDVAGFCEAARAEERFSHYISTIPANLLCFSPAHSFQAKRVWSIGDAPERGVFSPLPAAPLNTVVCSGARENSWYRKSNILGFNTVEWPDEKRPPFEDIGEVIKPVATNCDCLPYVHRMGRYGRWTKGVLSHDSFYATYFGLAEKPWS
jgi:hypothetical protein